MEIKLEVGLSPSKKFTLFALMETLEDDEVFFISS